MDWGKKREKAQITKISYKSEDVTSDSIEKNLKIRQHCKQLYTKKLDNVDNWTT